VGYTITCGCGRTLRYGSEHAGKRARCPQCHQILELPAAEPAPSPGHASSSARAQAAPAPTPPGAQPEPAPRKPLRETRRYACSECQGLFQVPQLVKFRGRVICRRCAQDLTGVGRSGVAPASSASRAAMAPPARDNAQPDATSPPAPPSARSRARNTLIGVGVAAVAGCALLVASWLMSPKGAPDTTEERLATAAGVTPEAESPLQSNTEQPLAQDPRQDVVAETPQRAAPSRRPLLSTFLRSTNAWDDWFWDYEPVAADDALTNHLLANERLVGDGASRSIEWPLEGAGNVGFGLFGIARPGKNRRAVLGLYEAGEGTPLESLKRELGPPRIEETIEATVHLIYGYVDVVYDDHGAFLGVVHFSPLETAKDDTSLAAAGPAGSPPDASGDTIEPAPAEDRDEPIVVAKVDAPLPRPDRPGSIGAETPADEGAATPPGPAPAEAGEPEDARATTFAMKYRGVANAKVTVISTALRWVRRVERRPAEADRLPRGLGRDAAFFVTPLGPARQKTALIVQPGRVPQLYVDADIDRDLAEEKPYPGAPTAGPGKIRAYRFGPVTIETDKAHGASPIRFFVETYGDHYIHVYPAGCYMGKVRFGRQAYNVALVDRDQDGRYDRVSPATGTPFGTNSDAIAIDFDRNNRFDTQFGNVELQPLSPVVGAGGDFYRIEVQPDGTAVRVAKTEPQFGTFDVTNNGVQLLLFSDTGVHQLDGARQAHDSTWRLPAGDYTCWTVVLNSTDRRTGRWSLASHNVMGRLKKFRIDADKTTKIDVGPPLLVKTDATVRKSGSSPAAVSLGVKVIDDAGIEYDAGASRSGRPQPAPRLRIRDRRGRVLEVGQFEYG
jgi:hypothetical protein